MVENSQEENNAPKPRRSRKPSSNAQDNAEKQFDKFLNQQKDLIEKLDVISGKFDGGKKKDFWDVVSSLSGVFTFLSSLVIAGLGVYFTDQYRRQDVRISQAQTMEKFIPYLSDKDESKKRSALLAIFALQDREFTTRMAASFASNGNLDAIETILKESPAGESKELLTDSYLMAVRKKANDDLNNPAISPKETIANFNKIFELRTNDYIAEKWGVWVLASIYTERGNVYRIIREFEKAESDFNYAIQIDPENSFTLTNLGMLYADKKDYAKSLPYFNKAIETSPYCDNCYGFRAYYYVLQKDFKNAEADYLKATEVNPLSDYAYANLGDFYRTQNEFEKAEKAYKKASEAAYDENTQRTALIKLKMVGLEINRNETEIKSDEIENETKSDEIEAEPKSKTNVTETNDKKMFYEKRKKDD